MGSIYRFSRPSFQSNCFRVNSFRRNYCAVEMIGYRKWFWRKNFGENSWSLLLHNTKKKNRVSFTQLSSEVRWSFPLERVPPGGGPSGQVLTGVEKWESSKVDIGCNSVLTFKIFIQVIWQTVQIQSGRLKAYPLSRL